MEQAGNNRTDWIIDASEADKNKIQRLIVSYNQLSKTEDLLEQFGFSENDTYYVNLSDGNKLMVIAVMNYF